LFDASKLILPFSIKQIIQMFVETMLTKDLPFLRIEPHAGAVGTLIHGQGVARPYAIPPQERPILRAELGYALIDIDDDYLLRLT
jgi:hypothetical protein